MSRPQFHKRAPAHRDGELPIVGESAPKMKVVIAVPAGDQVATGFAYDLARLVGFTTLHAPELELRLTVQKGTILPSSRTRLVNEALSVEGATHILWLDSDMRFPKETLLMLLARNEPIVGVNYPTRMAPVIPTAYAEDTDLYNAARSYVEPTDTGLIEVTAAGFGVMLMQLDVFRKLERPFFMLQYSPGSDEFEGEDVFMLSRARQAGFKVWIDADLSKVVGHLGEYQYGNVDALNWREMERAQSAAEAPASE